MIEKANFLLSRIHVYPILLLFNLTFRVRYDIINPESEENENE